MKSERQIRNNILEFFAQVAHTRCKEIGAAGVVARMTAHIRSNIFGLDGQVQVSREIRQGAPRIWCETFHVLFLVVVEIDGHEPCRLVVERATSPTSASQKIDASSIFVPITLLHVRVAEEIVRLCTGLRVSWQASLKHVPEVLILLEFIRVMAENGDIVALRSRCALVQNLRGSLLNTTQRLSQSVVASAMAPEQ